jgi:hypothetical protein
VPTTSENKKKITKIFKDTHINIASIPQNTMQNIVEHPHKDKYNNNGIYQMKCLDCPLKYIGKLDRAFCTRYKEHNKHQTTAHNTH